MVNLIKATLCEMKANERHLRAGDEAFYMELKIDTHTHTQVRTHA